MRTDLLALPKQPLLASISEIVYRSPGDLKPWPGNARKRNGKQLTPLKAGIRSFGITNPPLTDEHGVILYGHGRVQAALELKLTSIPTIIISGLSEVQKRALVLADNKIAELSTWDESKLKAELEILLQENIDIEITGFTTAEIDLKFGEPQDTAVSDPADLQPGDIAKEIVTRLGDLWILESQTQR